MKKRVLSLLLVLTLLLGIAGCSGNTGTDTPTEAGEEPEELKPTGTMLEDKYLVKDGASDYVLVLPENAMKYEELAAEEFTTFMQQATGYKFKTVEDDDEIEGNYISIGITQQVKTAFPSLQIGKISGKQSSYYIAAKDDNLYVVCPPGFEGAGTLYGVYDLLHDLIGYTYYDETEIYVNESPDVNLWSYEGYFVDASIDMRTHSTTTIYVDNTYNTRLRYINFSRGTEWNQLTSGHSQLRAYLHPTFTDENNIAYGVSHPEWFLDPYELVPSESTNQLCWTAGGDPESLKQMQQAVANQMIYFLQMDTVANYFMFGQHDNHEACTCQGCQTALNEWAGTQSGLQINFLNGVLDIVNPWLEENQPGREVFFVVYAYHFTEAPPVAQDEDGQLVPFSERVIPDARMKVMWAPISANYAFPFDSPINVKNENDLQGWKVICSSGQLFTYLYDLNMAYYFINFYNFGTVQSMVQELEDAGCTYLLIQGPSDQKNLPGFQALRTYCNSNIMWDSSQNYQALASDFIQHYYKDAAEPMQELFDMIIERNAYYAAELDQGLGTINAYPTLSELYPKAFAEQMEKCFERALEAIEHYSNEDPSLYQTLKDRIMKEYLCVIFLKATVYGDYYTSAELDEMREIWYDYITKFGIGGGGEGRPLPTF
ncbi:MAG: DUF4838 domain-containing protein [Oscillospiraceae bacterium]|nr:DUF4838 domain-containing protein [Oscillospiraceae bacterium]